MTAGTMMLAWLFSANPPPADVYYLNQHQLRIPISVDPARKAEIKELILFMSADEGQTWHEQAVATPDQDAFPFYAPRDGMYWFSVRVINQQNRREPEDMYKAPPSQKILIDTLKPILQIKSARRQGDEVVVDWEIQEDHPDWSSLKLEYRTPDAPANLWYTAPVSPGPTGQARIRVPGLSPVAVRLQMQDLATNASLAQAEVPAGPGGGVQLAAAPAPPTNPAPAPAAPPPIASGANSWDSARSPFAAAPGRSESPAPSEPVTATPVSNFQPAANPPAEPGTRLVASTDNSQAVVPASASGGTRPARGALPALQMVNNKQLTIDYEITKEGPSGIGKVELWMTRDDGKTWERFAENPSVRPPMSVELPGEGIYGFRLVLQSKAGRYKPPPAANDLPEMRVELDATPPSAQLFRPEPDPKEADALILSWSASDRNLALRPITLQWAEQPGKEWHTIVSDWPNDGHYTWKLPKDVPYLVYLRLTVHDTAGNSATAETPEPVCIDLVKPDGRLLGIVRAGQRAAASAEGTRPADRPMDLQLVPEKARP